MDNAPGESLRPRHVLDANAHGDAERVRALEDGAPRVWRALEERSVAEPARDASWVLRL